MPHTIIIASANPHKVRELVTLLGDGPWQLEGLDVHSQIVLPPETSESFSVNAARKAEAVCAATGEWALGDDSGLCVEALFGAPGVLSARYAGEPPDDARNNDRLLADLTNVAPESRTARFSCVLALARPAQPTQLVCGECVGTIALAPRGTNGFGYDPLFVVPGLDKTFAELASDEKHRYSHRARAAAALRAILIAMAR